MYLKIKSDFVWPTYKILNILFLGIVLPCPGVPPSVESGAMMWYDIQFTRYTCPAGKQFESGAFPYWYSNCTVEKIWDPPAVAICVGK